MSRAWKDHEKRVARAIHGERTSRPYANYPDAMNEKVVVECKTRKALPQWLWEAVEQARSYAGDGQLAVVSLHEKHRHQKNDLVVMTWADFAHWFEELTHERVPEPELSE